MKKFRVHITETHVICVDVNAVSAAEARKIVEKQWRDGDYINGALDYHGVNITVPKLPLKR